MASRVTFVSGTAEVKRREHHDNGFEQNPAMSTPPKVLLVDGKCTCCPYGYHIDLDFLRYCEAMSSGGTLKQLKRIQRSKRKLRKSMEIMLQQHVQSTEDGGTPPPDVVNSTEASRLMNMVEYEQTSTHKILDDIDSNVDATIASIDYMMTSARKSRNISSDSDESPLSPNVPRYNTFPLNQSPNGDESSHLATSLSTSGRSDSMSSLSSVSTVSSENPQGSLMPHGQAGRHHVTATATAEVSSTTKYQTVTSAQIAATLATHLPQTEGSTSPQGSMTNISKTSLHAIREAMAMSLHRMRELEEQVKAIPILQVRISVLKEEKRLLMLQHKAKISASKPNTRSVGVGEDSILPPFSDKMTAMEKTTFTTMSLPTPRAFDFPSNMSPRSTSTPRSPDIKSPPQTMPKPKVRNASIGDHSVIEPYLLQAHLPTGFIITENQVQNEIHSSIFERETHILNRSHLQLQSDRIEEQLAPQPQTRITINQIQRGLPKPLTRSIGIGEGNVFDSGLHIHEKELRTVIIGQAGQVGKRNVGIECCPSTRDVGVHFCCDDAKPSTRTVGVNVNTSSLITSLNFKGEELREALQNVLHKNVRSTGTNCNFRPLMNDASTMYQRIEHVSVGVGEECRIDVDIRPHMAKKSVGINVKPENTNRSMNTEKGWLLDQSTNTPVVEKRTKATTTEKPRQLSSATFMEKTLTRNTGCQTDVRTFLATDQLKNAGCNTVKKHMQNVSVNTDVKRLVWENFDFEVCFRENSANTTFSVADKCVNTDKDRYSDRKNKTTRTVGVSEDRIDSFVCSFDGIDRSSQTREITEQDQRSSETATTKTVKRTSADVSAQSRLSSEAFMGVDMSQFMNGKTVVTGSKARKRGSGEFKQEGGQFKQVGGQVKQKDKQVKRGSGEFDKSDNEEYHFTEETYVIHGNIEDLQTGDVKVEKIRSSEQTVIGNNRSKVSDLSAIVGGSVEEKTISQEKVKDVRRIDDISANSAYNLQTFSQKGGAEDSGSFQTKIVEEQITLSGDGNSNLFSLKDRDQKLFHSDRYSTSSDLGKHSISLIEGSSVDSTDYSLSSSGQFSSSYSSTVGDVKERSSTDHGSHAKSTLIGGNIYWYPVDDIDEGSTIKYGKTSHSDGDTEIVSKRLSGEGSPGLKTRLEEETILRRGVNSLQSMSDTSEFAGTQQDGAGKTVIETEITQIKSHGPVSKYGERGLSGSNLEESSKVVRSSDSSGSFHSGGYSVSKSFGSDSMFEDLEKKIIEGSSRLTVGNEFPVSESTIHEQKSITESVDGHSVTKVTTRTVRNGEETVKETKTVSGTDSGLSASVTESPSVSLDMSVQSVDIEKLNRASLLKSELNQLASEMKSRMNIQKEQMDFAEGQMTTNLYSDDKFEQDGSEFSSSQYEYSSSVDGGSLKSCMKRSKSDDISMKKGISFAATVVGGYELNAELQSACEMLAQYLTDSTTIQTKELNASMNVIQQDWFRLTNNKLVDPHQVEDYISCFNEISKKLMEHIVNMADANGNTALHYSVSNCNFEVVGLLLDTGVCDLNKQNKAGYTAIMLASLASIQTHSQEEVVRRLFSEGDINLKAVQTGQTAMMLAVSHGRTDMVRLLLDNGAHINEQDDDGSTALMCACEHGHGDIVKLLLTHPSCDATLTDNDGSTALTIAMEAGHRDIGVILYAHLNFAKGPNSPGIARKRRSSSSPTPSL